MEEDDIVKSIVIALYRDRERERDELIRREGLQA